MNAKKCKALRKFARQTAAAVDPPHPDRRLVVGKKTMKNEFRWLDFKQADALREEMEALWDKDPVHGSADEIRMKTLEDILDQYNKAMFKLHPWLDPDAGVAERQYLIDQGVHTDHEPIRVVIKVAKLTAINDPKTVRGIYRSTKRFIGGLQRQLGYQRISI